MGQKHIYETLKKSPVSFRRLCWKSGKADNTALCDLFASSAGNFKMVELYGAAMVAEEMEQVVNKLIAKEVDSRKMLLTY